MSDTATRQERRGRKTTEEEVFAYLRRKGVDPDVLLEGAEETPVPDDEGFYEELRAELWRRRQVMTDTALVNGLKALTAAAAAAASARTDDAETVRGVDEILADAGLPDERRIEIGREEIVRLTERRAALELVVAGIEGASHEASVLSV